MHTSFVLPEAEGAAFSAVNPRFDQLRDHAAESIDHGLTIPSSSSPEKERLFGLVTLENIDWTPHKPGSCPPSLTAGLGIEISVGFALAFNRSWHAMDKNQWAVIQSNCTALILSGIRGGDRPTDPTGLPPCVRTGLTAEQAISTARRENDERFKFARVPRSWTVAIRPTDYLQRFPLTVPTAVEGGNAC